MSELKISGGYILVARKLFESGMMDSPPLHWKLWIWMLGQAQFRSRGLRRGQFYTSINKMRDAMSWRVGYRVERPSKDQIRNVYEAFTKATMITTTKATHGMIITILNYSEYQDPKNYEAHNEAHDENATKPTVTPQYTEECIKTKKLRSTSALPKLPLGKSTPTPQQGVSDAFLWDWEEGGKYSAFIPAIDGKGVRILRSQVEKWQGVFPFIDVPTELESLRLWFESEEGATKRWEQKSAFMATFGALKKRHTAEVNRLKLEDPSFDPDDPSGRKALDIEHDQTQKMLRELGDRGRLPDGSFPEMKPWRPRTALLPTENQTQIIEEVSS